jgi:hypothetical protein
MKPYVTTQASELDMLKIHIDSLYDVNNIFKSFDILNDKEEKQIVNFSNMFTNNLYYDFYKIKCEDQIIFKSKLIDHKLDLDKKIQVKQQALEDLKREMKIVNKEKLEILIQKDSLHNQIKNLKVRSTKSFCR